MTQAAVTATTTWFLDVDGVLSPLGRPDPAVEWVAADGGDYIGRVPVAKWLVERIVALHTGGLVEVRWLTSWEHDAAEVLAPAVGLPAFPVHTAREHRAAPWWKQAVVEQHLANHPGRVVWTDDQVRDEHRDELESSHPGRSLVIAPAPRYGLTPEHLDAIEAFAAPL